jgi:hypothetical protein
MSFSVLSRIVRPLTTPALLMRTVGLPSVERTCEAAEEMDSVEDRSQWK